MKRELDKKTKRSRKIIERRKNERNDERQKYNHAQCDEENSFVEATTEAEKTKKRK